MTKSASARHHLKYLLFQRDGWQDEDGKWHAMCGFGCREDLIWTTATIDRWPVMGQHGGKYVWENCRLACKACNSRNRNHKILTAKDRQKAKRRAEAAEAWAKHKAKVAARNEAAEKRKRDNRAIHNEPKPDLSSFRSPGYSAEVKRKLRENYPKSEGRDRNGIPVYDRPVIYDVAKGKFRYE